MDNKIKHNNHPPSSTATFDNSKTDSGASKPVNTKPGESESSTLVPAVAHAAMANVPHCESTTKSKTTRSSNSKKAGNRNALVHGVFSSELTLPWESADDFEKLHASFKEEWKPSGCSEEAAVLDVTYYTWIGWRAAKMAVLRYHRIPFGKGWLDGGNMSWQDVLKHEEQVPNVANAASALANALLVSLNDLVEIVRKRPYSTDTSDGKAMQAELGRLGYEIGETMEVTKKVKELIQNLVKFTGLDKSLFENAYEPDVIEQQIKVKGGIDARIDKVFRRLTSLKEYKRVAAAIDSGK